MSKKLRVFTAITLLYVCMGATASAQPGGIKYLAIDAEPAESVVPELQGVVVLCALPEDPGNGAFVRLMTLNSNTGAQFGLVEEVVPPDPVQPPDPCLLQTREHILLARQVGVPSVMLVTSDMIVQQAPLTYDRSDQVGLGAWTESPPLDDVCETGKVTAVCEMLPEQHPLGQWRLWIGTEGGFLVEVAVSPASGQLGVLGRYPVVQPPEPVHPVSQIGIIPQNGYYALGVRFGDGIRGKRPLADGGAPQEMFNLHPPDPGAEALPFFDHFYPPDPVSPLPLVFANAANGTIDVAEGSLDWEGDVIIAPTQHPPEPGVPISQIVTGSLVMLAADSSAVFYDPWFSDSTPLSACYVEISEGSSGECIWCCDTAGDADNSSAITIGDVTFLIARIFGGGPAPVCQDEGDADGSNTITIGDVTYLIARIFSGGPAPVCGTTGG